MKYKLDKKSSKKFIYDLTHFDESKDKKRLNFLKECERIDIIVHEDGSFSACLDDNILNINKILNILNGDRHENLG